MNDISQQEGRDAIVARAVLLLRTIEQSLVKSNFSQTAHGLDELSQLVREIRNAEVSAAGRRKGKLSTLRAAIRSARVPLHELDSALSRLYKATRK